MFQREDLWEVNHAGAVEVTQWLLHNLHLELPWLLLRGDRRREGSAGLEQLHLWFDLGKGRRNLPEGLRVHLRSQSSLEPGLTPEHTWSLWSWINSPAFGQLFAPHGFVCPLASLPCDHICRKDFSRSPSLKICHPPMSSSPKEKSRATKTKVNQFDEDFSSRQPPPPKSGCTK